MEHPQTDPRAALSLVELNGLVKRALTQCLPDACWLQAELSEVRAAANGHCYLEFVQKDPRGNGLIAKANGTIWSNIFRLLKPYFEEATGQAFVAGIQVLVKVSVQFHELYGYSLTVHDIDPAYTLGDMARRRREILRQLQAEGVLTLNKELEFPLLPQRVAVISSPTAAGYGDFCHQLRHNPRGFYFYTELFPAVMQGQQVEASILSALDAIHARLEAFDVVVIIRGGGATSDLSGFDTYLLAAACAQFPLPILTGIGHERDDTVLDSVAHTRVKTPTAAAEQLIACVAAVADELEYLRAQLQERVAARLDKEHRTLAYLQSMVPSLAVRHLSQAKLALLSARKDLSRALPALCARRRHQLDLYKQRLGDALPGLFARRRHQLELYKQRLADASPERLLSRGYSITLQAGKAVTDAAQVQPGDTLTTRLHRGEITSTVTKNNP